MSHVPHSPRRSLPDLCALLVASIWGTGFVFQKVALDQFNVWTYLVLRDAGMLALAWAVLLWRHRRTREPLPAPWNDRARLAQVGLLGYTCYIPLSTVGLSHTTAFSNALLIATAPLFMVLLATVRRLEPVGRAQYAGMVIALGGIAAFVLPAARSTGTVGVGDLISLAAAAFFAGYSVTAAPLHRRYPLAVLMAYTMTAGALPIIVALAPQATTQDWSRVTPAGWAAFLWTVVVPVYVGWTLWHWVIARSGVARASVFMYLVPIVGGATSWVVLGEACGPLQIAGAALTLDGIAVARRAESRRHAAPPAVDVRGAAYAAGPSGAMR